MKFRRRPDIDNLTRVQIAVQAFIGQGVYGEITRIASNYQVSRLFVYQLLWPLLLLFELEVSASCTRKADIIETDRHILLLRLEGHCSLERISQIIKQLGLPFSSVGYISQRIKSYASVLPKEPLVPGAQIVFIISDEIFTQGQPILLTIEPRSLAIIKIELAEKRDGESWKMHWKELVEMGLIVNPIVVSDQGSGLRKGCELMGLTHHPDLFHLLRGLARMTPRFYSKAIAAITYEYERARVFESGKTADILNKRMELYLVAQIEAEKCIWLYDSFSYLWSELRVAMDLLDSKGVIQDLACRQAQVEAILQLMRELNDVKLDQEIKSFATGMEGYWGYFQRIHEVYLQLLDRYPHEVVRSITIGWQFERQATNINDYGLRKRLIQEAEFNFAFAALLMPEQHEEYEIIKKKVREALDSEVRSSSLVENVNSNLRALLETCRGQVGQEMLDLFAYVHNHRRFLRGKRTGRAPIEILTGKELEKTWLESLLEAA